MRWLLLILAALLLAGGIGWWMDHGAVRPASQASQRHRAAASDPEPTLYRWVDAHGVVNITDTPPKGRRYTIVRIDPDRNVVPMPGGDSTPKTSATH